MASVTPLSTAGASVEPSESSWVVKMALLTGIPMVIPICWLIVARPASLPGSPEVAVTMNPTMTTRFATPPTNVAMSSRMMGAGLLLSRTRDAVAMA